MCHWVSCLPVVITDESGQYPLTTQAKPKQKATRAGRQEAAARMTNWDLRSSSHSANPYRSQHGSGLLRLMWPRGQTRFKRATRSTWKNNSILGSWHRGLEEESIFDELCTKILQNQTWFSSLGFFGFTGSLLWHLGFLQLGLVGTTLRCGAQASLSCGSWAL